MEDMEPEVSVRGQGEPEVAVVGGIHGDEPSGARAVERLLADELLEYQRPVKYIVANPSALEQGVRYVDVDMNRVFPGDPSSGDLERRLAAAVCSETSGYTSLALHSTRSQPEPFALVGRGDRDTLELAASLPVEHVVDESSVSEGSFTGCGSVVSVECGCQGTEAAADTAEDVVRAFLDVVDAADTGYTPTSKPDFYAVEDSLPKEPDGSYSLHVDNFSLVREGEVYADYGGGELTADRDFYPILTSAEGYRDILGFRGRKVADTLEEAVEYFE